METKLISIRTRRYSEFFRRLLREYASGATVVINQHSYPASEFPQLIESWCTNAKIAHTWEFLLLRGETELFGFHDHPDELWAACSELPFIERLASERIVRYRVCPVQPAEPLWMQISVIFLVLAACFLLFRSLVWFF